MDKGLLSVGLDVGTTTTQLIVSRILIRNRAAGFAVPEMEITGRQVLYRSPVHFTPLIREELVDGDAIVAVVEQEYANAGISWQEVDSGAVIITGETSRKENAASVLKGLAEHAGAFVVATAGPDLESVLAAKGSGAVAWSEETGKKVLHMDIGGGTANLALIEQGRVTATGCLNVGGRLIKYDASRRIRYISPVLQPHTKLKVGDLLTEDQAMAPVRLLAGALEGAAGLRPRDEVYRSLLTKGAGDIGDVSGAVVSFSGGVADCIGREVPWDTYGDLGPLLGRAIGTGLLCRGEYRLGSEPIRATVIGAGCHSASLSGSTVYVSGTRLPLKNLPVTVVPEEQLTDPEAIRRQLLRPERWGVLALKGWKAPAYSQIAALADVIARAVEDRPCYVALEEDMAKALGHALALRLPEGTPCVCLDRLRFPQDSYLDVGEPVGPALPVVIKTLILER